MSEVADYTYNHLAFTEIMRMIWKRLNDHGKNWRHVYKSLVLLEYVIKTGSERVTHQCKENIFAIQTLKDFQHFEEGKDQGQNVREKAKQLVSLLQDDERLQNERSKALKAKERLALGSNAPPTSAPEPTPASTTAFTLPSTTTTAPRAARSDSIPGVRSEIEAVRPSTSNEEELQLQLALAMSREEQEEKERAKKSEDLKLSMVLAESKQSPPAAAMANGKSATPNHINILDLSIASDPWGDSLNAGAAKPPTQPPAASPWGGTNGSDNSAGAWGAAPTTSKASEWETKPLAASIADPWSSFDPVSSTSSITTAPFPTATPSPFNTTMASGGGGAFGNSTGAAFGAPVSLNSQQPTYQPSPWGAPPTTQGAFGGINQASTQPFGAPAPNPFQATPAYGAPNTATSNNPFL